MPQYINKSAVVAEIGKLIDEIYAGRPFDSLSREQQTALWYVKSIMSSVNTLEVKEVQEEPVSIWHDASEKSDNPEDVVIINPSDNTGEVLTKCTGVNQGRIWAYTSELLNLDNPCKTGKNLQEEPISEDLEEVAEDYCKSTLVGSHYIKKNAFKAGAKWKEKEMQSTIELAEDHAMLAGMAKMKEQMMANAIDAEVKVDAGGYPYIPQIELYDYDKDIPLAKEGDKYKVVLIKDE